MKIVSWNVAGFRACLKKGFDEFFNSVDADIFCIQESKVFEEQFDYAKTADLLLLDDIGAENITPWSRDEILFSILQYRMDEKLPTFFTSNLTLEELEIHLSIQNGKVDKLKSNRIIERIKYMCDEIKLISNNYRK